MRASWVAMALVVLLVVPSAAQDEDHGLAQIWSQVLRDPLKALPLENPAAYNSSILRLDRIARGFDNSQRILGDEYSGPMLRRIAPHAGDISAVSLSAPSVMAFLATVDAYRAGNHPNPTQAWVALLEIKAVLDRTLESARQYPEASVAWDEAYAWWLALQRLGGDPRLPGNASGSGGGSGAPGASPSPSLVAAGELAPGGRIDVLVRDLPGPGTLVFPWGEVPVAAGPRVVRESIPANQSVGPIEVILRHESGETSVVVEIGPIPLQLQILGPRQVFPRSTHTYTITIQTPVPLDRPARLAAFVDGQAVPLAGQQFQVTAPDSGTLRLRASGGPGPPWADGSVEVEVEVVLPGEVVRPPEAGSFRDGLLKAGILAPGGLGDVGFMLLFLLLALLVLFILWLLQRLRRGDEPAPPAKARRLLDRFWQWWRNPDRFVARDFRRAARLLADAGDLQPGATHSEIAAALQRRGLRQATATRLADAYERYWYAADALARHDYWKARGRP